MRVDTNSSNFSSSVDSLFQNCRQEDPQDLDFPKLLRELEKLFPDPVDCFDIERAFAVLDENKNGNVCINIVPVFTFCNFHNSELD